MSQIHGRFEDALFQQTQHLRFLESDQGRRYMTGFQRDYESSRSGVRYPSGAFLTLATESLRRADPVYVSPDVTEIIATAMKTFEPEPILPSDPFVPAGFAYFPRSVVIADRQGNDIGVRALSWLPILSGGGIAAEGQEFTGVWLSMYAHETDALEGVDFRKIHPLMELQYLHGTYVPFNDEGWFETRGDAAFAETAGAAARDQWVLPQVMWRIGQQVVPARERPARNVRRDARRHGLIQEEVSVLRLRRSSVRYEGEGESEVEWDHRWLVRGHWRNQYFPSLKSHRQIWINPYVKGPDDKPLILTERAVEFVR